MADLNKINIRAPFAPPSGQTRLNKATIRAPFSAPSGQTRLNKATIRIIFRPKPPRPQRRDVLPFSF